MSVSGQYFEASGLVNLAIFGTLFQDSMDEEERHALGAHYTAEYDIQRIIGRE